MPDDDRIREIEAERLAGSAPPAPVPGTTEEPTTEESSSGSEDQTEAVQSTETDG